MLKLEIIHLVVGYRVSQKEQAIQFIFSVRKKELLGGQRPPDDFLGDQVYDCC